MMTTLLTAVLCLACVYGLWLMSRLDRFLSGGKSRRDARPTPRKGAERALRQFQSVLNHLLG